MLVGAYFFRFLFLFVLLVSLIYWRDVSVETEEKFCSFQYLESFHPSLHTRLNSPLRKNYSESNIEENIISTISDKVCADLLPIYQRIYETRESNIKKNPNMTKTKVVIAGGGTVGLIHALQAYEAGSIVTLVEKRSNYTRNIWFDLYGEPWFSSLKKMETWSDFSFLHAVTHGERAISVRSQILERYLSQILFFLDVEMFYGYSFNEIIESKNNSNISLAKIIKNQPAEATNTEEEIFLPFDILVGADGSKSQVRKYLKIDFLPIENINIDFGQDNVSQIPIPSELNQVAFVLRFKANKEGKCPQEAMNQITKEPVLPWEISFKMPGRGVLQVFKRFFENYCELQIFFDAAQANNQIELYSDGMYDWDFIFEVVNHSLAAPFGCVQDFLDSLKLRKLRGSSVSEYDVDLVTVSIRKASENVRVLPSRTSGILLVGDAAVVSHFRLGIGINSAFDQLDSFQMLLEGIGSGEKTFEIAMAKYKRETLQIQNSLAQFEVLSILYEAYCDYLIFIDPGEFKNIFEAMIVFGKDYISNDYNQEPFTNLELFSNCPTLQNFASSSITTE